MKSKGIGQRVAASIAAVLTAGVAGFATVRAADTRSETLVYAVYSGQDTATQVFKTMKANQNATGERIEAYAVVSRDLKGKIHVRDQRKTDAGVGAAIGGVIGLLGGPVGVAVGATAGGALGYLTGDAVGISRDQVQSMKESLTEDSSAIVVVLDDRWVQNVEKDLNQAHARAVIANQIASK
jgi:uncharacterized membrane protein